MTPEERDLALAVGALAMRITELENDLAAVKRRLAQVERATPFRAKKPPRPQ